MLPVNLEFGPGQLTVVVGDGLARLVLVLVQHVHDGILHGLGGEAAVGHVQLPVGGELVPVLNVIGRTLKKNRRQQRDVIFQQRKRERAVKKIALNLIFGYLECVDLLRDDLVPRELALVLHVIAGPSQQLLLVMGGSLVLRKINE